MPNPLLESHELPPFSAIKPEHVEAAVRQLIADNRAFRKTLLDNLKRPAWETLVAPLEAMDDRLEQVWSPVSHLNAVCNNEALREAYNTSVALITEYSTEVGQDKRLYQAYQDLANSDEYSTLNQAQRQAVDNALRDFRLSGVTLEGKDKERYGAIKKRLSELSTQFSNNVLDATQAWHKHFTDTDALDGLPGSALEQAAEAAKLKNLKGYAVTLDIPSFLAVMTYANDRELRQETYTAFVTRASAEAKKADGSSAAEWDNTGLINETLALRHELAQLLGFKNYAERSLATKMADTSEQVLDFLNELADKSKPLAERDIEQLRRFATEQGCEDLQAWDVPYYSEKLRQQDYALSQEELRPFFPAERVISGLFEVVKRLYDIEILPVASFDTWHPDVRFYHIFKDGEHIASFYFDIFARENKRGGAWMADCRVRRKTDEGVQRPVAFLTCNFTPPLEDTPSLLTHDEVTTLFHEFGHGLHHMLTQIDVASVSGINGVAWDAVELPSQFLENWCWEPEVVPLISGHFQSGEPLPQSLLSKLLAARNFQSGMQMVRQLEFSLFDFRLHAEYNPDQPRDPQDLLDEIRRQVSVVTPPAFNRFQNSFTHIFAGGYAAGYYSYKWAEVLSADAFSRFEEEGIFNRETGESFQREILQQGGSRPPMELFIKFRGREPSIKPLLRHAGIETSEVA
ncbi:oligopeptidase A [Marinimicrobium sp. ABcell2]|uniref:oligopeptidase A n=1 Tax=Marinimicrobium sp. ABcell2 TaxID=3069751 RepID=UPI0027AE2763|nr:oligopeptidase A [Marinimicrobium sp. ABcell2]MDQ2078392.1 oligopeptidase A [Marinimicrobium sp. ABcell2]